MAEGYSELANETVSAANGVDYAYRDTGGAGDGQSEAHCRWSCSSTSAGTWTLGPALIDVLASTRRV